MRREEIPARLRVSRAADCQRIPLAALKSMRPADVAPRLNAAAEFRRRARVPHLDGDLMSYRLGLASEVLTTADPRRAAQLLSKAGVAPAGQRTGAAPRPAGRPAAVSGPLAKSAPRTVTRSVTVPTPALDSIDQAPTLAQGITALIRHDLLSQAHRELGHVVAVHADLNGAGRLAKAERYERQAAVVTDPADRRGYLELARAEREKAGL